MGGLERAAIAKREESYLEPAIRRKHSEVLKVRDMLTCYMSCPRALVLRVDPVGRRYAICPEYRKLGTVTMCFITI